MILRGYFFCAITMLSVMNSAHAQTPRLGGLVAGVSLEGDRNQADTLAIRQGRGLGALLGFGVTQNVMVLLGAGFTAGAGLSAHADLAARLSVPVTSWAVLYGQAAFAAHGREAANDRMLLGDGLALGVGAELFFKPRRSIEIGITRWKGNYDEVRPDRTRIDVDAKSFRLSLGMNVRPPL